MGMSGRAALIFLMYYTVVGMEALKVWKHTTSDSII
tara:strand:+ start:620 stop:727 length:108 start_codon:yes stop_codon:yes gene_type:complete